MPVCETVGYKPSTVGSHVHIAADTETKGVDQAGKDDHEQDYSR